MHFPASINSIVLVLVIYCVGQFPRLTNPMVFPPRKGGVFRTECLHQNYLIAMLAVEAQTVAVLVVRLYKRLLHYPE